MRILHTSDWHLGQEFYAYDRSEEHAAFLDRLRDIVAEERPDVLVVCGDIYHNAAPSNAVMRMFTDRLDRVRQASPATRVIVTAGNHDSSARLEVSRSLWEHLGVTVVGRIERDADGGIDLDRHIIPIDTPRGERVGYVVAMPHVFPQNYPLLEEGTPREERQARFLEALAERVRAVNREGLPVVMMAHLTVAGTDLEGHYDSRGGLEATELSAIPVPYDYLALGHIHRAQSFLGGRARYCGSPLPVDFDEQRYAHSVTLADLPGGGAMPALRTIPIENPRPLLTLPDEATDFDTALGLLADFPAGVPAYLRLHVRLRDVAPADALERAAAVVRGKAARFCCFKWERPLSDATPDRRADFTLDHIRRVSPVEVARHYYADTYGAPLDPDLEQMLREAIARAERTEKE